MPGNAIYNEALIMQQALRRMGLHSEIFAERIHPSLQKAVSPYAQYRPQAKDVLLFHYSLGSALSDYLLALPQKLLLRYHNVTPPHFLVGANPWLRAGADKGRRDLPLFASRTALALADSKKLRDVQNAYRILAPVKHDSVATLLARRLDRVSSESAVRRIGVPVRRQVPAHG